jgi:hypothetical protein
MSDQPAEPGRESDPRTSVLSYLNPDVARPRRPVTAVNVMMGSILSLYFAGPFGFCVGAGKALSSAPGSSPVGTWVCLVIGGALFLLPLFVLARYVDRKRHPGVLAGACGVIALSVVGAIVYGLMPY